MTRCGNGHYYDEKKYALCPHCGIYAEDDGLTVKIEPEGKQRGKHGRGRKEDTAANKAAVAKGRATDKADFRGDDSPTVYMESEKKEERYVAGWLVCTMGVGRGRDYRIFRGNNFVGRDYGMDIRLEGDSAVSRVNHCSVVYENKSNLFYIVPMENIVYMGNRMLNRSEELKSGQSLVIGGSTFVFIPFCEGERRWEKEE